MKKVIFTFLISLAMAFAPGAFAQTNDTGVVNSGDNVDISSSASQNSAVKVINDNHAVVIQKVEADVNTGDNKANGNIGESSINTGSADVKVNLKAHLNKNLTVIDPVSGESSNKIDVVNTGDNLNVNANASTNDYVKVYNNNHAFVKQDIEADVNTGDNKANRNIGDTSITTGNASVKADLKINANSNLTAIENIDNSSLSGLSSNQDEDNKVDVVNTGDNLKINANVSKNTYTKVKNNNSLFVIQKTDEELYISSGWNKAKRNIGATSVNTGNSTVRIGSYIQGNQNHTFIGNGLGFLFEL